MIVHTIRLFGAGNCLSGVNSICMGESMDMNGGQNLRQHQRQILRQELRQSLHILELPLPELLACLRAELAENCLLEQDEDCTATDADDGSGLESPLPSEPDLASYLAGFDEPGENPGRETTSLDFPAPAETLHEHLLFQLHLASLPRRAEMIGEFLLGQLDEDGYLTCALSDCASLGAAAEEAQEVLRLIQSFDPPGVGARNLAECLLLQLPGKVNAEPEVKSLAGLIIREHLRELAEVPPAGLAARLGQPRAMVEAAVDLIKRLDPRPGRNFGDSDRCCILPDVTIARTDGGFTVTVNEGPGARLRISRLYQGILSGRDEADRETVAYLRARLQSALRLIKAVEERRKTLGKVTEVLLELQRPFFAEATGALQPVGLREIAEITGLHESTISRAMAGKYLATPRGVFAFRYFLQKGLPGEEGGPVSVKTVQEILRGAIAEEAKPLSDEQLASLLRGRGIAIARRTVAKYREEMGIPPAAKRRKC